MTICSLVTGASALHGSLFSQQGVRIRAPEILVLVCSSPETSHAIYRRVEDEGHFKPTRTFSCACSKGCAYALRQLRSSPSSLLDFSLLLLNAHAAKDPLLLTSVKKHPTQFCFALRLQCDPLNVTVNEIAAYLQLPALSTELTVFTQDHRCGRQALPIAGSVVPATFHR